MTDSTARPTGVRHLSLRAASVGAVALAIAAGFAGGRATLTASSQRPAAASQPMQIADAAPPVPLPTGVVSYSTVVDRVAPAVVTIRVEKQAEASRTSLPEGFREFFGPRAGGGPRSPRERGLGSGVIVGADGHILTNHHVIDGAERIRVDLADGRSFPATVVGTDAASDLALVKVEARNLPTLAFGDSDRLRVGDVVLAFGNPLGVGQTMTMGIVSAKGRVTGIGDGNYEDFLQTDAPINEGNSGGALVNLQGEVVGINAQILSPSGGNIGLGFAIPSVMARAVADQLREGGVVHRSKMGVTVQPVTPELAEGLGVPDVRGALVSGVEPGSPADRAGLRQGDVIVGLDGRRVPDANALRNQIASARPGSSMAVDVVRGGKPESMSVRLVEREGERVASASPAEHQTGSNVGMAVRELTPQIAQELELPRGETGLVVTDVDPVGVAASSGIQAGDVIKRVNNRDVTSVSALRDALEARAVKPALVLVHRRGAGLFLALPRERS